MAWIELDGWTGRIRKVDWSWVALPGLAGLHGVAVLAGSWLADVAGLDGLAKPVGRVRCLGRRSWVDCQDWKVEYSCCCQGKIRWQNWIAKIARIGTLWSSRIHFYCVERLCDFPKFNVSFVFFLAYEFYKHGAFDSQLLKWAISVRVSLAFH